MSNSEKLEAKKNGENITLDGVEVINKGYELSKEEKKEEAKVEEPEVSKVEEPAVEASKDEITPDVEIPVTPSAEPEPVVAPIELPPEVNPVGFDSAPEIPTPQVDPSFEANNYQIPTSPIVDNNMFSNSNDEFQNNYNNNDIPTNNFNSVNVNLDESAKVFKNSTDIDDFAVGLTADINKAVNERAIEPMKATVEINNALLSWGREVVEKGLNKSLFDRFEEIEAMYNKLDTATYENNNTDSNNFSQVTNDYNHEINNNSPIFGDDQNNFGGMGMAA